MRSGTTPVLVYFYVPEHVGGNVSSHLKRMLTSGLLPPNAVLLITGICQRFLHWLGETGMWNVLPILAPRFGTELNNIDDHRFRNILADLTQIGRVPPKSM